MTAKYIDISKKIKNDIENKKYKDTLPTGKQLSIQYNVSLLTISKALDILVKEGLVIRKQGAGTFIKKITDAPKQKYKYLEGTTAREGKDHVKSHVLHFEVEKADKDIANKLNISEGDFVYYMIRVREINGVRLIIEYTYMSVQLIPGLKLEHLKGSVYDYIQKECKINITSSHMFIKSGIPTNLELENLDFNSEKFTIETDQVVYSDSGTVVEYTRVRHVHDSFVFENHFTL